MQNCQRILQPIKVINPYATLLELPQAVFKPRRTNAHYLHFIEAVTFYHQYQREQKVNEETGEIYIETTIEDIKAANHLLKEILLRKSDELTGACRNYFEDLKAHLAQTKESTYTNRSIGLALRIAHSTVKRYNNELLQAGLIKLNQEKKTKSFWYEVLSKEEYQKLKEKINNVLDEMVNKIEYVHINTLPRKKELTGPDRLSRISEPVKEVKTSEKQHRPSENTRTHAEQKNTLSVPVANKAKLNPAAQITYNTLVLITQKQNREYCTSNEISQATGRTLHSENRILKSLTDSGMVERTWRDQKYLYRVKQA
jgi:predicted transcriptional regulator